MPKTKTPQLPKLLKQKIYKTGQTRGADDDVIYQNRVLRNNTVLIPFKQWINDVNLHKKKFENGFIVLISPKEYFEFKNPSLELMNHNLELSVNSLVFYETRFDWIQYPPLKGWKVANSRNNPLGGEYVARVPSTTSSKDSKINSGYNTTPKGAGIRLYEYADKKIIDDCKNQLEAVYWLCQDSVKSAIHFGMSCEDANTRKKYALSKATESNLLDYDKLVEQRILNNNGVTICPFCLEKLSAFDFFNRVEQAEGREVPDLTITEINLFHINELKYGEFNHKPYNLGWGHHHCNVVVKDSGIYETLDWIKKILDRNKSEGYYIQ
ncbi:TPA: BstXI family restriction endonuclease [Streptococcus suis]